jgi:hypothetical protein
MTPGPPVMPVAAALPSTVGGPVARTGPGGQRVPATVGGRAMAGLDGPIQKRKICTINRKVSY